MKCYICGNPSDYQTTKDRSICRRCTEKYGLVVCTHIGKVIDDKSFACDKICNDCIYLED